MTGSTLELARHIRDGQPIPAACGQHKQYTRGCNGCQRQASNRSRALRRAAVYGWRSPEKLLPADVAREHIRGLRNQHGMSYRHIAALAGVARAPVHKIAAGSQPTATKTTLDALLAVQPDRAGRTPRGMVDAVGAARRLQALMVMGYRAEDLAPMLDTDPETVRRWCRAHFASIAPTRDAQITALAERLDGTRGPSDIARARAAARGWVPLAAWDNIDDPGDRPRLDGPADDTPDHILVDEVLADRRLYADLNAAEQILLWQAWSRHRTSRGIDTPGIADFAIRFGITRSQATTLRDKAEAAQTRTAADRGRTTEREAA